MGTEVHERIKVLHVTGWLRDSGGGTERLLLDILPRLSKQHFEVHLAAIFGEEGGQIRRRLEGAGVGIHPLTEGGRFAAFRQFLNLVRTVRCDILHTHHHTPNVLARLAGVISRVPVIFTYEHNPHNERYYYRFASRVLNRWTSKIIVISQTLYDRKARTDGIPSDKLVLIYDGADLSSFRPLPEDTRRELREKYGVPAGSSVIGAVGRLEDYKRYDLIIEAARLMSNRRSGVHFLIAGDGPARATLEASIERYKLQDRVKLLGYLDDVNLLYAVMDVFVTATWEREGFGLTSAEAMACGVPIVVTDTPVNQEVVTGDCGIIVEPDPNSICDAVERLLDDRALSKELGQAGIRRARQHYDIQSTVEQLESLYLEAHERHRTKVRR